MVKSRNQEPKRLTLIVGKVDTKMPNGSSKMIVGKVDTKMPSTGCSGASRRCSNSTRIVIMSNIQEAVRQAKTTDGLPYVERKTIRTKKMYVLVNKFIRWSEPGKPNTKNRFAMLSSLGGPNLPRWLARATPPRRPQREGVLVPGH